MNYAGFWRRLISFVIDAFCLIPVMLIGYFGGEYSRLFGLYFFIPGLLISLFFHVYLVSRYGGTPGKLLMKIKITDLEGNLLDFRTAFIRYSVLFFLSIVQSIGLIIALINITDEQYFQYDYMVRSVYLVKNAPEWYSWNEIIMNIWMYSEFIVLFTNKKKRALHDFMAGSVVIKHSPSNVTEEALILKTLNEKNRLRSVYSEMTTYELENILVADGYSEEAREVARDILSNKK